MDKEEDPSWEMLLQLRVGQQLGSVEASAGWAWLAGPPSWALSMQLSPLGIGQCLVGHQALPRCRGRGWGPCVDRFRSMIFLRVNQKLFEV